MWASPRHEMQPHFIVAGEGQTAPAPNKENCEPVTPSTPYVMSEYHSSSESVTKHPKPDQKLTMQLIPYAHST